MEEKDEIQKIRVQILIDALEKIANLRPTKEGVVVLGSRVFRQIAEDALSAYGRPR